MRFEAGAVPSLVLGGGRFLVCATHSENTMEGGPVFPLEPVVPDALQPVLEPVCWPQNSHEANAQLAQASRSSGPANLSSMTYVVLPALDAASSSNT